MRIISGKYKGQLLHFPKKGNMRPTKSNVKESVFNILGNIQGMSVLDLCCGTGQYGVEAFSRGASFVEFVDIDIRWVLRNINILTSQEGTKELPLAVKKKECGRFIASTQSVYDIIFFDPPWTIPKLYQESLKGIFEFDILSPQGRLICEHPVSMTLPVVSKQKQHYYYGNTALTVLSQ